MREPANVMRVLEKLVWLLERLCDGLSHSPDAPSWLRDLREWLRRA